MHERELAKENPCYESVCGKADMSDGTFDREEVEKRARRVFESAAGRQERACKWTSKHMTEFEEKRCDYCGKEASDMLPSFWHDRTRWFCDVDCLEKFKAVVIGSDYAEQILDGEPGTAKALFEKLNAEGGKDDGRRKKVPRVRQEFAQDDRAGADADEPARGHPGQERGRDEGRPVLHEGNRRNHEGRKITLAEAMDLKCYLMKIAKELDRMNKLKALVLGLSLENGTSARNRLDRIMED